MEGLVVDSVDQDMMDALLVVDAEHDADLLRAATSSGGAGPSSSPIDRPGSHEDLLGAGSVESHGVAGWGLSSGAGQQQQHFERHGFYGWGREAGEQHQGRCLGVQREHQTHRPRWRSRFTPRLNLAVSFVLGSSHGPAQPPPSSAPPDRTRSADAEVLALAVVGHAAQAFRCTCTGPSPARMARDASLQHSLPVGDHLC